ncbi:MAG: DNA-processing protein DprA [Saprospiraceae bacterium]|nr:DNA-processing protein DprA [Saprospiraceae bacterium]
MIQHHGGVITEFPSGTLPDRENFPMRNRIIAMSDVVVVIESKRKGGSIISAEFANDFNRDVFALPDLSMMNVRKDVTNSSSKIKRI